MSFHLTTHPFLPPSKSQTILWRGIPEVVGFKVSKAVFSPESSCVAHRQDPAKKRMALGENWTDDILG